MPARAVAAATAMPASAAAAARRIRAISAGDFSRRMSDKRALTSTTVTPADAAKSLSKRCAVSGQAPSSTPKRTPDPNSLAMACAATFKGSPPSLQSL